MAKTLKVAILGCGRIAWAHALGWTADDRVEVVALADPDPAARDRLGSELGVSLQGRFADYRELLESVEVDLVSVCLWTGDHKPATELAVARGARGVLCEKPMAAALADALAMSETAKSHGALLATGHQRRFYPAWEGLRSLIESGELGQPQYGRASVSGGLLNNGTHVVDMYRYLLAGQRLERVLGTVQRDSNRYERGVRAEELALGWLGFSGGFSATLECNTSFDATVATGGSLIFPDTVVTVSESSVEILGRGGCAWSRLEVEPVAVEDSHLLQVTRDYVSRVLPAESLTPFAAAFVSQAAAVVDAVTLGTIDEYRCTGEDGYGAMEGILAIYDSVRVRGMKTLPLEPSDRHPLDLLVESGALPSPDEPAYDIR